jgi:hypothetical protein
LKTSQHVSWTLINLLHPSGFFLCTTRFNIQKFLHGAGFALSVLYRSQNRQRHLLYASVTDRFFITVVESVYSAVRTDCLHKAHCVSSFKG